MEEFKHYIDNIIDEGNNQINDKVFGVNYLEKIKYFLIDNIKNSKKSFLENSKDFQNFEIMKKYGQNNLLVKIISFSDSYSKIKNIIENDYLCIILKGSKRIEIYENMKLKNFQSLNLHSDTGLVLNINTIVTEIISKETVLLEIFNLKDNLNVENQ